MPAGVADKRGKYPKGTVNHAVVTRLAQMAKKRQALEAKGRGPKTPAPQTNRKNQSWNRVHSKSVNETE
jgi:hypothetical protein